MSGLCLTAVGGCDTRAVLQGGGQSWLRAVVRKGLTVATACIASTSTHDSQHFNIHAVQVMPPAQPSTNVDAEQNLRCCNDNTMVSSTYRPSSQHSSRNACACREGRRADRPHTTARAAPAAHHLCQAPRKPSTNEAPLSLTDQQGTAGQPPAFPCAPTIDR